MLEELLTEFSASMVTKELTKVKSSDPDKYQQTLELFLTAAAVGVHFLQESPEFREAFARIHSQFLQYPESQSTIAEAYKAVQKYNQLKEV